MRGGSDASTHIRVERPWVLLPHSSLVRGEKLSTPVAFHFLPLRISASTIFHPSSRLGSFNLVVLGHENRPVRFPVRTHPHIICSPITPHHAGCVLCRRGEIMGKAETLVTLSRTPSVMIDESGNLGVWGTPCMCQDVGRVRTITRKRGFGEQLGPLNSGRVTRSWPLFLPQLLQDPWFSQKSYVQSQVKVRTSSASRAEIF